MSTVVQVDEQTALTCPDCGERLTEHFDAGVLECGRCGRTVPLVACIRAVNNAIRPLLDMAGLLLDELPEVHRAIQ